MKNLALYQSAIHADYVAGNAGFDKWRAADLYNENGPAKGFIPSGVKEVDALFIALNPTITYDVPKSDETPHTDIKDWSLHFPHPDSFDSPEMYAHVLLHELSHYAGQFSPQRNARMERGWTIFDVIGLTPDLAIEELTAETAAATLSELIGLGDTARRSSLSYIQSFIKSLEQTPDTQAELAWDYAQDEADKVITRYRAIMGV